jgi:hypothetical protein
MELHRETAQAFRNRIESYDKNSQSKALLEKLDRSLVRLYNANCLSLKDFKRFDDMIFNRLIKLEA